MIFALIRAFTRQSMSTLGNAWVIPRRITLWVLVPWCCRSHCFLFNKVRCKTFSLIRL
ncbi:potassium-transporting ATPase subunit KdpA [Escherichia coli]